MILLVGSLLSGPVLVRQVFGERDRLLIGSLGILVAVFLVLLLANWQLPAWLCLLPLLLLRRSGSDAPGLGRRWTGFLAAMSLLIGGYAAYAEQRFVDGDSWIHDPLISTYMSGIFPPRNPFFPDLLIHGHYGRDLLIAALTPTRGDPLVTMWLLVPVLQVAIFLGLFATVRRFADTAQAGLAATLVFFGVDVGFRVGLLDSWDGNHPVLNAFFVLSFYLMFRVLQGGKPLFWLLAGAILGLYQIVYETYFGLMLLTGLTLALTLYRTRRAWAGLLVVAVVALAMAFTEGGTMTEMVHRTVAIRQDTSYQSESQQVSLHFPKSHLFQVEVTPAGYQRISAAYKTHLFSGWANPPTGTGYMSIFDRRFLTSHWLPLYLCPLTLLILLRRGSAVGLGFWVFGAWAYLVPGLIDFGTVWEWEYFRWEMAAGVGFAGALGVALALTWQGVGVRVSRRSLTLEPRPLVWFCVLIAALAAGEKTLGDALIDLQQHRFRLTLDGDAWRTGRPDFGLERVDARAMAWLRARSRPGERFLSNLGSELPEGIWPDVELAVRTLTLPAGHAFPSRSEAAHAHPPFQFDALRRTFWQSGRPEMLTGIRWLYVDPSRVAPEVLSRLSSLPSSPMFEADGHRRQIFEVVAAPAAVGAAGVELALSPIPELRVAGSYSVEVTLSNPTSAPLALGGLRSTVLAADGSDFGEVPLTIQPAAQLAPGQTLRVSLPFATPLDEGDYRLKVSALGSGGAVATRTVPLHIDFLKRVQALSARVDLPGEFVSHRFYELRVGLRGQTLNTGSELEVGFRLRRPGGEYVWELDGIPQPLPIDVHAGTEQILFLQLLTPAPGPYDLELNATEKLSRRVFPLLKAPLRINVR